MWGARVITSSRGTAAVLSWVVDWYARATASPRTCSAWRATSSIGSGASAGASGGFADRWVKTSIGDQRSGATTRGR